MDEDYAIEQFLNVEQTMNDLCNAFKKEKGVAIACCRSWEQFEAEGFRVATVRLVEIPPR